MHKNAVATGCPPLVWLRRELAVLAFAGFCLRLGEDAMVDCMAEGGARPMKSGAGTG